MDKPQITNRENRSGFGTIIEVDEENHISASLNLEDKFKQPELKKVKTMGPSESSKRDET